MVVLCACHTDTDNLFLFCMTFLSAVVDEYVSRLTTPTTSDYVSRPFLAGMNDAAIYL